MNCQVTPFRNKVNLRDLTCPLSDDHISANIEASMCFLIRSPVEG